MKEADDEGELDMGSSSRLMVEKGDDKEKEAAEIPMCGCLSVKFYQPYFDVDTSDILTRISHALFYCRRSENFMELIKDKPDAYGPFWIATSLVFAVAVSSHISSWLASWMSGVNGEYDFQSVLTASSLVYSFASACPVSLYFIFRQLDIKLKLITAICLYGYSLFVFIPAAFICLMPSILASWLALLGAAAASSLFLARNLAPLIVSSTFARQQANLLLGFIGYVLMVNSLLLNEHASLLQDSH